ncbi:hypothetical protein BpHYR1_042093, partial [Brachionus plicatilis]
MIRINPLLAQNALESFNCDFKSWEEYYFSKGKNDQDIDLEQFGKYFRRPMLKKNCYGCLKQFLMLDMCYQFELDEIN